jgi:hypothetical protein
VTGVQTCALPISVVKDAKFTPPKNFKDYREWLAKYRDEIISDIDSIGRYKAEAKWGITHRSMGQLILARERQVNRKAKKNRSAKVSQIVPEVIKESEDVPINHNHDLPVNHNHDLPPFPAWSNDWELELQLRWLEIWKELRSG